MVAASWGDSDSDAEQEKQKTRCLMADDDKVSISDDKAYLKNMVFELMRIIDVQTKTIKNNDKIAELQLESIEEGLDRMSKMREEIYFLQSLLVEQRELTKASKAKAEFLNENLNTLSSSTPFKDKDVETLRKSLEELHVENVTLKEKIVDLSAHESDLIIKWEEEKVAEQIAQHKQLFKRFIPQK